MIKKATFAGGCFWCMEEAFSGIKGVLEVIPGYSGGHVENPSYEDVLRGNTGHFEAVQVTFDTSEIFYKELLTVFWTSIDPTDAAGQFKDRGNYYKTAIFYHYEEQRVLAEKSKEILENSGLFKKPIVTEILSFENFFEAEEYHKEYFKKYPMDYFGYKMVSGRTIYCKRMWESKERKKILIEKF